MKKEFSINYITSRDGTGTVYNQCVNITTKTRDKLTDILTTELLTKRKNKLTDYDSICLSRPILESGNSRVKYLNLTQRDFFNKYLKLNLKDRNTRLYIIDL